MGKLGLKYVSTTKYNLINKVLEKYIQYHFINSINHALNNDDLIIEHWMNECAYFYYYQYIFLFSLFCLEKYGLGKVSF